jgi:hypothetical protein
VIQSVFAIPEVTTRAQVREYEPTSIEARSQRIQRLLHERSLVFEQQLNAIANGGKIPPQSVDRWNELTRQIDREYAG